MNEFVRDMLLFAGITAWFVVMIWLVTWIVLARWDRREKDGPRCRACGYDLRASAGESCPECGKPLKPHGVWPVGMPRRGPAIHRIAILLWLCLFGMVLAANLYASHVQYWFEHEQHDQAVAILGNPESGAYDLAYITLSGEGWRRAGGSVRPDSWTIVVLTAEVEVQVVTADAESGRAMIHPMPDFARQYASAPAHQAALNREPVTPALLAEFHPLGLDTQTDEKLLAEMQLLIDLANHLADDTPLPREIATNEAKLASYPRADELRAAFGKQRVFTNQNSQREVRHLPLWPAWSIPAVGLLVLVAGTLLIRRRTYRKMAIDHIPANEAAAPTG